MRAPERNTSWPCSRASVDAPSWRKTLPRPVACWADRSLAAHNVRNVACTACHSVHSAKVAKGQLKAASDSETCYSCHKSERAKSMRTSHHPVREGRMGCTSCHNPHDGSQPKMVKADSINELCYTCHTEKRGPFLFEHAPVREECTACHEPHGSNHKRLLAQKLPNLCYNCHFTGSGHFGSGDNFSTERACPWRRRARRAATRR